MVPSFVGIAWGRPSASTICCQSRPWSSSHQTGQYKRTFRDAPSTSEGWSRLGLLGILAALTAGYVPSLACRPIWSVSLDTFVVGDEPVPFMHVFWRSSMQGDGSSAEHARRRLLVGTGGMTTVEANGVRLGVERFGDAAAPLVLLAGGTTMLSWPDALCEALARGGRHVVRYDLRDSGASTTVDPGAPGYTLRDLAADATALAREFDARPAHLAGIGVGGMVAQVAALENPDAFSALTLAGTRPIAPGPVDAPRGADGQPVWPGVLEAGLQAALARAPARAQRPGVAAEDVAAAMLELGAFGTASGS